MGAEIQRAEFQNRLDGMSTRIESLSGRCDNIIKAQEDSQSASVAGQKRLEAVLTKSYLDFCSSEKIEDGKSFMRLFPENFSGTLKERDTGSMELTGPLVSRAH